MPKQLKVFVEVQEESDFLEDKLEESVRVLCRGGSPRPTTDRGGFFQSHRLGS